MIQVANPQNGAVVASVDALWRDSCVPRLLRGRAWAPFVRSGCSVLGINLA